MSIQKDKNNTFKVMYTKKDIFGNTKRTTKRGFKTKKEAKEWEAKQIALQDLTTDIKMIDVFNKFLEHKKNYIKISTLDSYKKAIKNLNDFNNVSVKDLNVSKVMSIIENENINAKTKNAKLKYLKIVLRYCSDILEIPINEKIFKIKSLTTTKKEKNIITLNEYDRLKQNIPKKGYEGTTLILDLMFFGGLRIGEVLALQVKDFDFNDGSVRIKKTMYTNARIILDTPKTKSSNRTLTLPKNLIDDIKNYIYKNNLNNNDLIFVTWSTNIISLFKKALKKAKLKDMRLHDLRHSHASMLINSGVPIAAVSKRLGHSNAAITLSIYTHSSTDSEKFLNDFIKKL